VRRSRPKQSGTSSDVLLNAPESKASLRMTYAGPALVCVISREESWNRSSFCWVTSQLRRRNDTWAASRNSETLSTTNLGWKGCERPLTRSGLRDRKTSALNQWGSQRILLGEEGRLNRKFKLTGKSGLTYSQAYFQQLSLI